MAEATLGTTVADVSAEYSSSKDTSTPGGAALAQAEKNGFSTSDQALRLIAQVVAAAAAAAGCSAVGLGVAAPLCAWVGGKLGGAVYDGIKSLVGSIFGAGEAKKEIARRQKALQANAAKMEVDFAYGTMVDALGALENAVVVLHSQLFPDALKLTSQQVRQMFKAAGLELASDYMGVDLPADDTRPQRYSDICRSGTASPDGLDVPRFPYTMLVMDNRYATRLQTKCSGAEYEAARNALSDDDALARYPQIQAAIDAWMTKLQEAAKTVTGALINLSSNREIQDLLAQAKTLRESNAALAANKDLLIRELTRRKEYEAYYLQAKRDAALKRVAAEAQRSEEFTKALTATQHTVRNLMLLAGGILVASTIAAVVVSRRNQ
jgi:hypothetical protein